MQDPVYLVASQRLLEWQSGFGSTAITMVEHFFESDPAYTTYHTCQEFASEILTDFAYLYEEIGDDPSEFCGLFGHRLSCKHLRPTLPHNATDTKKYPQVGALAMSAAAVERAFTMWAERKVSWDLPVVQSQVGSVARKVKPVRELNRATGKTTGSHAAFSDTNWGEATRYYATDKL
ncbi:hypothetical protein SERLADRAFT_443419 [Serpula lacrymans var. lacrymans S7.9]|uniref:Uncharacterized protein n=1 Tax=Serpula lacrymans var. lacrymans (strain S7.9) TaxID=578457 RepID=F8PCG6_SERL9|nr:uncharacterized protein SERLADRAFT_443419 [Serpula lacrymans var. lacrymans S7.9]EGO19364.1 hypothetical protein SERLADRAFT_443419 [Serpula lacrymans var. lacrymans S7.9]